MWSPPAEQLNAVIEDTQKLLAAEAPTLAEWEDYGRARDERFQRLRVMALSAAPGGGDSQALARLYAAVLENDRRLAAKIHRQLSEINQELSALSHRRRALEAYGAAASSSQTYHRQSA